MIIPPFVQTWSNGKRKRFYLFEDERLCFNDNGFSTLNTEQIHPHVLSFKLSGDKILITPEDNDDRLYVSGSKKRLIQVDSPIFFSFRDQEFFIDGFCKDDEQFNLTGLDVDSKFSKGLEYARNDNTILIVGNTGTGKELLARNIHYNSSRRHHPFLTFNCASFEEDVAQMELFGNIKGAFTNAMQVSKGFFMNAGRGTLMLDEVGCLPMSVQPMLLRAIEMGDVKAIGSDLIKKHRARLIFTSNISPKELFRRGMIREDLFYRIESCVVYLSELTGKQDSIIKLAEFYAGDEYKISDEAKKRLIEYKWPGNIRELRNVMEHAKILMESSNIKIIGPEHFLLKNSSDADFFDIQDPYMILSIKDSEKENIRRVLLRNSWDLGRTSKELNICRSTLLGKIKEYKLIKY